MNPVNFHIRVSIIDLLARPIGRIGDMNWNKEKLRWVMEPYRDVQKYGIPIFIVNSVQFDGRVNRQSISAGFN
jgi:hypothetical protein